MNSPVWVFACGIYRSASTTQYLITRDIVEGTGNGVGIGYHSPDKMSYYGAQNQNARYIVSKVFIFLPEEDEICTRLLAENRLKGVCSIRDPRDVIASMRTRHNRHYAAGGFSEPFPTRHRITVELVRWLGDLQKWADLGIGVCHVSRYEDFTLDLDRETRDIADFLDIELSDTQADEIAAKYTASAIQKYKEKMRGKREDPHLSNIPDILFGKPGAYKECLTIGEVELLERLHREFMEHWGYL